MATRKFRVNFDVELEIELDDHVIDVVDDEWRRQLYNLDTPEEIASHVAWCLLRGWRLSSMDGWADQPNSNAQIIYEDYDNAYVEEIT